MIIVGEGFGEAGSFELTGEFCGAGFAGRIDDSLDSMHDAVLVEATGFPDVEDRFLGDGQDALRVGRVHLRHRQGRDDRGDVRWCGPAVRLGAEDVALWAEEGRERGPRLATADFSALDELRYFQRQDLRPNAKRQPVTW